MHAALDAGDASRLVRAVEVLRKALAKGPIVTRHVCASDHDDIEGAREPWQARGRGGGRHEKEGERS